MGTENSKPTNLNIKDWLVYRIINEQILLKGTPPTTREIGTELDLAKKELPETKTELEDATQNELEEALQTSTSVVDYSVKKLVKAGLIEKARMKNRAIKVLEEDLMVPIYHYKKGSKEDKKIQRAVRRMKKRITGEDPQDPQL